MVNRVAEDFRELEAVHRFPNISLNFQEAYTVGEQLWALGKVLQDDPRYAKPPNWVLTYRCAIRECWPGSSRLIGTTEA